MDISYLTNKNGKDGKGTLAAAIPGSKNDEIISFLVSAMDKSMRRRSKEVTCDLSSSMMLIAVEVFYCAYIVNGARCLVQYVFGFKEQSMHEMIARTIDKKRCLFG